MAIRAIQTFTTAICLQICVFCISHTAQETSVWDKEVPHCCTSTLRWDLRDSPKVIFNLHTSDLLRFSFRHNIKMIDRL